MSPLQLRIKALRNERGLTQVQLAQLVSVRQAQDLRARIFAQEKALQAISSARKTLTEISAYYGTAPPEPRKVIR